jgi:predicted Fe-Mo cluster-binding NifX family protein
VNKMKICIPTTGQKGFDDTVGEHFGRVPTYTIIDMDKNEVRVISNTSEHGGGQGYPPELMKREGVDIMVCQGLGRRAISLFKQMGIDVYIGARGSVRDALEAYKQGLLQKASETDACDRHEFRNHQRYS